MEGHILFRGQCVAGWVLQMLSWPLETRCLSEIRTGEGGGGRNGQSEKLNRSTKPTELPPPQREASSTLQLGASLEGWAVD